MKMPTKNDSRPSSISTMRYLAIIVALFPRVAAFSEGHRTPLRVGRAGSVSSGTVSTSVTRSNWPKTQRSMTDTRLHYISGADHGQTASKRNGPTWWNSIFGGEQSSAADDYLEFLDRRYNRILKDDEADDEGFSVMKWLYQNTNRETEASPQRQREEDALYVLGVASLASKKFLQKHHMPSPEETPSKSSEKPSGAIVTDAEIVETPSTPIATIVSVVREVARRRELLLRKQSRGVRFTAACTIKSVLTGPARALQALQKLYVVGGGKKSLAMTVAAVAALSFLLRPFIRVVAEESANTMRP